MRTQTKESGETGSSLARSHEFLITLFDSMEDDLAVIGRDYRVVEANRALRRRLGEDQPIIGEFCYRAFRRGEEPCGLQRGGCPVRSVWRTGRPSRVMQVHVGDGGRVSYLDIVASPMTDDGGNVLNVLELARDVTEIKRLEDQVIRTSEELSTLVSLSSAIACAMDLRAMLEFALDHALALTSASDGGIMVYGADGKIDSAAIVTRGLTMEQMHRAANLGHRPTDRMEIRRAHWDDSALLCVPIATAESVLGEMILSCPSEQQIGGMGLQLLVSVGSQLAVAIENTRLYEAVRRKEEAIASFLRQYIAGQEKERKRIARELHDETAQTITGLAIAVEAALQAPTQSADEVKNLLEPARALTERISKEIERIIRDLRPSLLDDLGLLEAVGWYADNRLKPLGIQVTFETAGRERRLSPELETALFRVAQEAISNIARHAKAENASVTVEFGETYVAIEVDDDGCGFNVEHILTKGKSGRDDSPFGLLGMSERVNLLGGILSIESRPKEGTSIRARVPLQGADILLGGPDFE